MGEGANFFHPHFYFSEKLLNALKYILYNVVVNLYIVVPIMTPSGPLRKIHEDKNREVFKIASGGFNRSKNHSPLYIKHLLGHLEAF